MKRFSFERAQSGIQEALVPREGNELGLKHPLEVMSPRNRSKSAYIKWASLYGGLAGLLH